MPQSAVVTFFLDDPLTMEDDDVFFVFVSVDPVPVKGVLFIFASVDPVPLADDSVLFVFAFVDPVPLADDGVLFVFASVDPVPVAGVCAFGVFLCVDPFSNKFGDPSGVDTVFLSFESGVPGSLISGNS